MRIYIPATSTDIARDEILPRVIHAATPDLHAMMPADDEEVLESIAMLAAADDSLRVLTALAAGRETLRPLRVVIAADVSDKLLEPVDDPDELPTALRLKGALPWTCVCSFHIDDATVADDIVLALRGDEDAFERVADEDLMWYDAEERADLIAYFS